jgi:DNA-binding transcriptional ArsR family regulator
VDDVARAIADPVRRSILQALAERSLAAGDIASQFTVSRPAVSRHLRVLRESGLVIDQAQGRRRVYVLDATALQPLLSWITGLGTGIDADPAADWGRRLDALETEVHRTKRSRRRTSTQQEETA